jgi:hypothetical protein
MAETILNTSEGFVDLRFSVIQSRVAQDGEASLVLGGTYNGDRIEISVHLQAGMLPSELFSEPTQVNATFDGIRMLVDPESTTNLANLFIKEYGEDRLTAAEPLDLSFTAVALAGDPRKIASEEVKFKLFHETGSTEDEEGPEYFEMFFNLSLASNTAELNEKDNDFRIGVLNALKTQPK